MASEDVIELGSSDDEAESASKKIKPLPNAMVHIPRKIHGVTIKPTKANPSVIPKELAGKNVTVTKISKGSSPVSNAYVNKIKTNGKQIQKQKPNIVHLQKPVVIQNKPLAIKNPTITPNVPSAARHKTAVNPLNIMKKINSQVVINKVLPGNTKRLQNTIKVNSPRTINNLPSSITITRTAGGVKRPGINVINPICKKQKVSKIVKSSVGEVLTVELDDDDVSSSSTSSPQWYLRPEETASILETANNKEPEVTKTVEITIEDSPVKPVHNKRTCEVGTELAITIDDSPIKTVTEKNIASGSDGEIKSNKVPHSKKKLEYPKESETVKETIEIEISPIEIEETNHKEPVHVEEKEVENIIEIEESPMKILGQGSSTPKKDHSKPRLDATSALAELKQDDELSEFHPVYRTFIKLCFELENSDDMRKIVEKKIKTYYKQVPKEYTESEEFIDMVSSKILAMKAGPEKMYLYIKDIVDELNLQRKMAKSQVVSNAVAKAESDKFLYGEESEFDSKRQRQIRKLEKTLKKLHRAIQKLEEQEVDFDDEEDSVYLLTESDDGSTSNKDTDKQLEKDPKVLLQRYKERMVRVHAKFCQLTNSKMPSEPRVQIDARPGHPSGPAKRLEKWINKKVPIGTPLPFPDFHDVLRCVREANEQDKLGWNEADIMEEARDLFTRCGKKLQRRRQENEWRLAASRISAEVDPAETNAELKKKLEENKKAASNREAEVLNKYADRQSQLKLEAVEIGDKEAEESPVESDEDETNEEPSLENKEKRKERLKRLLQEKTKKNACEKENQNNKAKIKNVEDEIDENKNASTEKHNNNSEDSPSTNIKDIDKKDLSEKMVQGETKDKPTSPQNDAQIRLQDENENQNKKSVEIEILNEKSEQKTGASSDDADKIHSLSDESNKVESDVDELHLLQKLHSENEVNTSTLDSSDSETPIAISDSLASSGEGKKQTSDVISIENSSYSESEINKDNGLNEEPDKVVDEQMDINTEIECSMVGVEKKQLRTNNDEYNESVEDILLASTDEEMELDKESKKKEDKECVNLNDDSISIGDTVIEGIEETRNSKTNNYCAGLNPKDSNMEIQISASESQTTEKRNNSSIESTVFVENFEGDTAVPHDSSVDRNQTKKQEEATADSVINDQAEVFGKGEEMLVDTVEDQNKENDIENVQKQDDASSVDSIAFVVAQNEERDPKATINIIESDSTEKQDDVTSVESVTYEQKEDENRSVQSSDDEIKNTQNQSDISEQKSVAIDEAMDVDLPVLNKSIQSGTKINEEIEIV